MLRFVATQQKTPELSPRGNVVSINLDDQKLRVTSNRAAKPLESPFQ